MDLLKPRYVWLAVAVASAGLVVASFALTVWLKLHPCPLCIFQRLLFMIMSVLALAAFLGARRSAAKAAGALALLTALSGAGVSGVSALASSPAGSPAHLRWRRPQPHRAPRGLAGSKAARPVPGHRNMRRQGTGHLGLFPRGMGADRFCGKRGGHSLASAPEAWRTPGNLNSGRSPRVRPSPRSLLLRTNSTRRSWREVAGKGHSDRQVPTGLFLTLLPA